MKEGKDEGRSFCYVRYSASSDCYTTVRAVDCAYYKRYPREAAAMSILIPVAGNICRGCGADVTGERLYWNDYEWQHWKIRNTQPLSGYFCGPVDKADDAEKGKE